MVGGRIGVAGDAVKAHFHIAYIALQFRKHHDVVAVVGAEFQFESVIGRTILIFDSACTSTATFPAR